MNVKRRNAVSDRYYIAACGRIYTRLAHYMLPLLRITLGLILIPHGAQKFFGWFGGAGFERFSQIFESVGYRPGAFWVTLVAGTELIGGVMLVIGLFTRFWAAALAIFMINSVWVTSAKGFFWLDKGSEYSILLLVCALVFLIQGGGDYSIDKKLGKEL
jgi:putative oxidoreductase